MRHEQARRGMRVRVLEHHRVEARRGLMGTVVAVYGGVDYIAVDVRLADDQYRLFWPRSPPLGGIGGACCSVRPLGVNSGSYSPDCVEVEFCELHLDGAWHLC